MLVIMMGIRDLITARFAPALYMLRSIALRPAAWLADNPDRRSNIQPPHRVIEIGVASTSRGKHPGLEYG